MGLWAVISRVASAVLASEAGEQAFDSFAQGVADGDLGTPEDSSPDDPGVPPIVSPIASAMAAADGMFDQNPPIPQGPGDSTLGYYASLADDPVHGSGSGGGPSDTDILQQIADNTGQIAASMGHSSAGGSSTGGGGGGSGGGPGGGFAAPGTPGGQGGTGGSSQPWFAPPQEWNFFNDLDEAVSGTIQVWNMWGRSLQDGIDGLRDWNRQMNENTDRGLARANQAVDSAREYFLLNGQIGSAVIGADMNEFMRQMDRANALSNTITAEVQSADRLRASLEPSRRRGEQIDRELNTIAMELHRSFADAFENMFGESFQGFADSVTEFRKWVQKFTAGGNGWQRIAPHTPPELAAEALLFSGAAARGAKAYKREVDRQQRVLKNRMKNKQGQGP